ncbi:MAG: N-acetylmuramoyl-L-alanine amidase [Clostridiales bacterium]|jgi:N-acetylmuramoyl-L-alanine amidase|nr:N-acetylmuramoyl-L-alanine amidase [Clostridiales bacterium]
MTKKYIQILVASMVVLLNIAIVAIFKVDITLSNGDIDSSIKTHTIVIDAGHGGRDGGVVGRSTGVKESDVNLEIALILERLLIERGCTVVMTRSNQDGLYGDAKVNRKRKDLKYRKDTIIQADPSLVISIHQNSFVRSPERGAQVFYGYAKSNNNAKDIATNIQYCLNTTLPECDRTIKQGNFYILKCTQYPSILIECGFLSTPAEEILLIQPDYQTKIARAIVQGVQQYFDTSQVQT